MDFDEQDGRLPSEWWIGLAGWVLEDGNYTDFVAGDRREFALEFGYSRSERLRHAQGRTRSCRYTSRTSEYEMTGPLLRSAPEPMSGAFIIDFGLLAYTSWMVLDDLTPPAEGTWLTGGISLYVDHFQYMDELAKLDDMPELIYTWTIEEVQLNTTPMIQVEYGHPLYIGPNEGPILVGDPSREAWRTVPQTRVWDVEGNYRLRCRLESDPATKSMQRSGPRSPYGPLPPASSG